MPKFVNPFTVEKTSKITMPRNKEELNTMLKKAFVAGCEHGYAIEHTQNVFEQEDIGAMQYVGEITKEEMYKKWDELRGY